MESIGYEWRGDTVPGTLYLRKAGPMRFNAHLTRHDGVFWKEHLLFRDYLRADPKEAERYADLKRELMSRLAHDPPAYNTAKEP